MSDIKLIIDGKEYICRPVEETDTAAESERPRTGYERVNKEQEYYTVYNGFYDGMPEDNMQEDDENYSAGNYYNDEQLAADVVRADTLMRRLRQWQALNDEPMDWRSRDNYRCYFDFDYDDMKICISHTCEHRDFGGIYFSNYEKAQEAFVVFRDDLMWYFTEYRQRLDEPERSA